MPSVSLAAVLESPALSRCEPAFLLASAGASSGIGSAAGGRGEAATAPRPEVSRCCDLRLGLTGPASKQPAEQRPLLVLLAHVSASAASRRSRWPTTRASTIRPAPVAPATCTSTNCGVLPNSSRSSSTRTSAPRFAREVGGQYLFALGAEPGGAVLDVGALNLRHARGRRALARREREHVQEGQPAFVDEPQRVREHRVRLGREAGDEIGAEHDVGPQLSRRVRRTRRHRRAGAAASCASGSCRRPPAATGAGAASAAAPRRSRPSGADPPRPDRSTTVAAARAPARASGFAAPAARASSRRAGPRRRRSCRRRSARSPAYPPSTSRRTCATTSPAGTERDGPRPNGMMQNVQRWSQPFCTCT